MTRAVALDNELSMGTFQQSMRTALIAPGIEQYLANLETNDRALRTISKYRNQLNTFQDFCTESGVTPSCRHPAARRLQSRNEDAAQTGTLFRESITVKQFLRWCTSRGLRPGIIDGRRLHGLARSSCAVARSVWQTRPLQRRAAIALRCSRSPACAEICTAAD
jgi:hypothetical protein